MRGESVTFCIRAHIKVNTTIDVWCTSTRIIHVPFKGQYVKLTIPITIRQQQQKKNTQNTNRTIKPEHTAKTKAKYIYIATTPREYFSPIILLSSAINNTWRHKHMSNMCNTCCKLVIVVVVIVIIYPSRCCWIWQCVLAKRNVRYAKAMMERKRYGISFEHHRNR